MFSNQASRPLDWAAVTTLVMRHRKALLAANVIALAAVIVSVPIPLLMPLLVDEVLLEQPGFLVNTMNQWFPAAWHGPVLYIVALLLLTVVLRIAGLAFNVWQTRHFTLIAKDVTYGIRDRLLRHVQRVSMSEFETMGSANVASHMVTDVNAVDEFIGSSVSKALISALTLVGVTSVLLWMHWQLALFILIMNPIVIYFTVVLGKHVKHLKTRENRSFEIFQQSLAETLDGIQQIRAANQEKHYISRVIDHAKSIRRHAAQFSWRSDAANRLSMGVFLLGFDTFRAISMFMVVFSDLSVGEMMAVFGYLWFMMGPVQELLNIHYAYFAAKAALERLNGLLAMDIEPQYPHRRNPFEDQKTVGIRLEDICFRYGDGPPVLNHVNLVIEPGEKVALVGASGGGKSTMVQVMLGMYPAESGKLYFNDVPVSEIGLDVVRRHVATVLQHPAMFNDTVRHNLSFGADIDDSSLYRALTMAQLDTVVRAWPDGLDTVIGQRGVRLSGGQKQRLAIARMLLTDPQVVILDEATSALDTETEQKVHAALKDYLKDRTTVIIAHRLSAVKQADRVYVFEDGQIAEQGHHDELLRQKGLYARLYGHLQR